ncbi:MAG: BamA/TamA family outer membrane protein [Bacteroidales bacterium]|nr:BamA/TamA family outer membrane protein [Bacteroidales bacterium]
MKLIARLLTLSLLLVCCFDAKAQVVLGGDYDIDYLTPKTYEIGGITIDNDNNLDQRMVLLVAGLQVGDVVKIPGDKISTAIDNLWQQGLFDDVQVLLSRIQDDKVFLKIVLRSRPKLAAVRFNGISGNDADKLGKDFGIHVGDVVTENMLKTSVNKARSYYADKGFTNVQVNTSLGADTSGRNDYVVLTFDINKGKRVKIDSLIFEGNEQVPTKKLLRKMKNTHDVHYFKKFYVWTKGFWSRSKFRDFELHDDLDQIISYYNELGYRDARIVMDTMWPVASEDLNISANKKKKQDRVKVKVKIYEGSPFYFRNITFSGNTVYSSDLLSKHLRINKGDPYNKTTLETNLTYNPSGTDITSMYMDNGYLFFNVTPVEVAVQDDSIDIDIRIVEGKQARIRNVIVEGNTITNDKIIYRELHTKPGDLFNRDAIIRSRRELVTLGYFKEETLIPEPRPNTKDGTVDIVYKVEENQTSQLQLQGGYGNGMIIGQVGIQLNNFSARNIFNKKAWQPLPAGDGQKLMLNAVSNGRYYYALNAGFTEPWLGGKRPQAFSISVSHNLISNGFWQEKGSDGYYSLAITGATMSLTRRVKWPDDYFIMSQSLAFRHYTLNNYTALTSYFIDGHANDLSYSIGFSRNSLDSPIYPRSGSEISVQAFATPPYSIINGKDYSQMEASDKYRWLEYYKFNLRGSWMLNLVGDVVLNARFRFGYMGYYNEDIGLSPFGRYYVGGDGLSSWVLDGREVIPLRGYKNASLSPDNGASVFDRYTLELRQPIIESASATIYVLGFLEGGNSWATMKEFQPFRVYNSAGVGVRLYMPMFGLIGIDWGYGFDGINGGSQFHFSIGQSID